MSSWQLSDRNAYHYFLPEPYKFSHTRGIWSYGLQILLLGSQRRISWRWLRSYRTKRKGFHSHLRSLLLSYLLYIKFPKSEDSPFYTWCPEMSSYKIHLSPQLCDPPTAPPEPPQRWLDRNGFFKQCWLTAWSGYWTKASDACYQSGRKKKKSLFWHSESGTFLVRIEFSMKLKIIYSKIFMDKHSILCERKVINVPLFSFIQESKSSVNTTSSGHDGLIRDSVPSPQKLGTCRDTE